MSNKHVLVVDDETNMRRVLEIMLQRMGYCTDSVENGVAALEFLDTRDTDLVISDLKMPVLGGLGLLEKLRAGGNDVPVIVITAHGTVESAVEAMKLGAFDYLLRPFDVDALNLAIRRVFAAGEVLRQNQFLREELDRGWGGLIGSSEPMRQVYEQIKQVAPTRTGVMILGETGTGKELVARAIHRESERSDRLFVPINCAAIPADMMEAELFGFDKGAFTGAVRDRVGKFELANGGTIFLDEITEMPIALQSKLLRVLQEQTVERLGSNRTLELDLRVIAATNRRPQDAVRDQRLREDLYYRLNVFAIELPPLREHPHDISLLVEHFVAEHGGRRARLTPRALDHLQRYAWPGNIRELSNMIERALVLTRGDTLDVEHFPLAASTAAHPVTGASSTSTPPPDLSLGLEHAVEALESRMIRSALEQTEGNKTKASALLGISERSMWYKLKKYGLN
ncbi:sigma-54 dependent transcriptional regulator [Algiphilus sp. W345]|uniref:Sigma-54 dependent transcriptional regulator n=1 Tax=Banduia mediterranea TaxID=3075609 RepID=A0ABU2WEQ1_9GAMM|nr:sigma-54 dependent transcriptional regulator [Algiphilus sp. W345]MDT0496341.1 sigma-54 dependent transcriptional regulator [Algiphilus sp. W345]